jgi:hypothetical protein
MSIFPGNILVIDDQFNIGYQANEPEDLSQKLQWENFRRLRRLFDTNGFCYSVITETKDIGNIIVQIKKYQNIRLLILDLDLDESGDVEDSDIAMVKQIVLASLNIFGYYFLAVNSSYSEKWETIREELLEDLNQDPQKNHRKIHFLTNFCIALDKENMEIEDRLLKLLSDRFANELITQFEAKLNLARDKALSPFMDFATDTWEQVYKMLKEDMDSREHINFTLNSFLFGLLKQHMIDANYTVPNNEIGDIDAELQQAILKSFNYLMNTGKALDNHPIWTGNLYYTDSSNANEKYLLVITPECDIAQAKGSGYTVISGFEFNLPVNYKPEDFSGGAEPPLTAKLAGKAKSGNWKTRKELEDFYFKGQGFYPLLHSSLDNKHLILDLRSAYRVSNLPADKHKLILRVNEPIITDITDKFSAIFNRKGIPRLIPKNYK